MAAVTLVTAGAASADRLSDDDYREIFDELRSKTTLRRFAEFIGSAVSFAWWSKYERGEAQLDRARRNELRAAVGLARLPATVAEATADVDPDARVWRVGPSTALRSAQDAPRIGRVVLLATDDPLTLRVNGDLEIIDEAGGHGLEGVVTGVTRGGRGAARSSIVIGRGAWERLNAARLARGLSWEAFLVELAGGER